MRDRTLGFNDWALQTPFPPSRLRVLRRRDAMRCDAQSSPRRSALRGNSWASWVCHHTRHPRPSRQRPTSSSESQGQPTLPDPPEVMTQWEAVKTALGPTLVPEQPPLFVFPVLLKYCSLLRPCERDTRSGWPWNGKRSWGQKVRSSAQHRPPLGARRLPATKNRPQQPCSDILGGGLRPSMACPAVVPAFNLPSVAYSRLPIRVYPPPMACSGMPARRNMPVMAGAGLLATPL